ncbi:MAG: hypothetical protein ABGW98_09445, partial [Myxococcales bacterium]
RRAEFSFGAALCVSCTSDPVATCKLFLPARFKKRNSHHGNPRRRHNPRSQRFALIAENGVVTKLAVEEPMKFDVSSADAILAAL